MIQSVLIIGKVWPEPSSSAAGSRIMQLIQLFQTQNWVIFFASAANESEHQADIRKIGVKTCPIELNDASFDAFIKELDPNIVLFDRFTTEEQYGWRVAEQCPNALRMLDTEDLHCLRAARHKALKENRTYETADLFSTVSKREIASVYRCDLSLIISLHEMDLLKEVFKVDIALLHYVPFLFDSIGEKQIAAWPNFSERKSFISIGNFLHEPNWDAVLFLKQDVWPLIRKLMPKAEMNVYGAYPSHKVFELHNPKEGFLIKGRANDVGEVMSTARVCLAPLRFGAGLKGKLVDAMMNGTPSVTTDIGAESMNGKLAWNGEIANNAEEIAIAAVNLYSDKNLWEQAQENGISIINACYSKEKHGTDLISKIHFVSDNLIKHRLKNFIGEMLMQHTTSSSRYMSLWIEAKNKVINS
ncbi:glycosyltransferase [Aurantibacillus circumpalustris]|uniref:glycosyltransferase n=1 Tax=Aurantibacillus circumpalustris TaxID=3036359 RepID=UPI00295AB252|nr:glycosyltransferase [Aurantibacillus circumpalustris]